MLALYFSLPQTFGRRRVNYSALRCAASNGLKYIHGTEMQVRFTVGRSHVIPALCREANVESL